MKGYVDESGRALVTIPIIVDDLVSNEEIPAWVDTGFTGELVIPRDYVDRFCLKQSASIDAVLADGSITTLQTYSCRIQWFGQTRNLEVIVNDGSMALLGVGLLLSRTLTVDYFNLTVSIEPQVVQTPTLSP